MTLHKNWSRSQAIIDAAAAVNNRRLGWVQGRILKSLLEMGTYPGTWGWKTTYETTRVLESLRKRGLVVVEEVDKTDWRGNRMAGTTIFYRPAPWMLEAMNAASDEDAMLILKGVKC